MHEKLKDTYVGYKGMNYKVHDFRTLPDGIWLDLGIGYWIRYDKVFIVDFN